MACDDELRKSELCYRLPTYPCAMSWDDHACCSAEQTDAAWQLASSILEGTALRKALDHIVQALAEACVHAQHQEGSGVASSTGVASRPSSYSGRQHEPTSKILSLTCCVAYLWAWQRL